MSLSDEERSIVVTLELEKAQVAYNETLWLMVKSSWSGKKKTTTPKNTIFSSLFSESISPNN